MKPLVLKAADGVRNDVPLERFSSKDLSSGYNIDIDETGAVSRRKGLTKLFSGTSHSIWSDREVCYYVQGTTLRQLHPDKTSTALLSNVRGQRVNYGAVAGRTYWTDELQTGVIYDGQVYPWGITPPVIQASLTDGNFSSGVYGFTATYVRFDGQESGANGLQFIRSTGTNGVALELTASPSSDVANIRVYATSVDGGEALAVDEFPNVTQTVTWLSIPTYGNPCQTMFKGPAPSGQLVTLAHGRAYVAKDNFLFYSDPFEYELFDIRDGFLGMPSRITMFLPMPDGFFLGTKTETYFFAGTSPDQFQVRSIFPYGVVEGTGRVVAGDLLEKENSPLPAAMWLSEKGICMGAQGGQAKNLTSDRYAMPSSLSSGASILKVREGTPHFVVTTN